jgi:hypothetical protein
MTKLLELGGLLRVDLISVAAPATSHAKDPCRDRLKYINCVKCNKTICRNSM